MSRTMRMTSAASSEGAAVLRHVQLRSPVLLLELACFVQRAVLGLELPQAVLELDHLGHDLVI
jgi:hypothetical protein